MVERLVIGGDVVDVLVAQPPGDRRHDVGEGATAARALLPQPQLFGQVFNMLTGENG
jgi:hypothetical protein